MADPPQRKRRSDAGTVRLTERDILLMTWLADMRAVYESDLRILIGRLTGFTPGDYAIRDLVLRWRHAGFARAEKLMVRRPRVVWLLPAGAAVVDERQYREASEWTMYHAADVSRVRLWVEGPNGPKLPGVLAGWESERRWTARVSGEQGSLKGIHVPDGVIHLESGRKVAVEVERTVKDPARLARIVATLLDSVDLVMYAIPAGESGDAINRAVHTAYKTVEAKKPAGPRRLEIVRYPDQLEA